MLKRFERKDRRKARIRAKISGTPECPRLAVFTSNKHMVAQVIDDLNGKTLAYADDIKMAEKLTKSQKAAKVGEMIAENAKAAKINTVVFDRGGKLYQGRVKALAEAARAKGLKF